MQHQNQNTLGNEEIKNLIEQPNQEIVQAQIEIQIQEIQVEKQGHTQQHPIQGQQPVQDQQFVLEPQTKLQAEIINNNNEYSEEQKQLLILQYEQQQQQQLQLLQQQQQQGQQQFQQSQEMEFKKMQYQQALQLENVQQQQNFGYQQDNPNYQIPKPLTPAQAVALLSVVPIPDQFCFTHEFRSQSPCFEECGGYNLEESIFKLPSIGELGFDVQFNLPSRCAEPKDPQKMAKLLSRYIPQKALTLNADHYCRECCSNEHFFRQHTYSLQNDNVRIEFFGHVGKMYIRGVLVLELVECIKNYSDVFQGSKFSTMPQMVIYEPQYHSNTKQTYPIRMKAQKSNCPEHPYSFLGFQSIYGCCKLQRPFEIYGLKQGQCDILNRRTQNNACNSHLGFRDSFICNFDCCNFPDYKEFEVIFQNVLYIDRLKILFGLIHFNMYNKWEHTGYKGRFLLFQLWRIARKIKYGDAGYCSIF